MGSLMVLIFVARFAENRGRVQALLPAMLFVDTRIGESGLESNRRSLANPLQRRCAAELSALRGADPTVDARTCSRIRARWFTLGTETPPPRFEREMQQATGLVAQGPHENVSDPADFVSGHTALRFWDGRGDAVSAAHVRRSGALRDNTRVFV